MAVFLSKSASCCSNRCVTVEYKILLFPIYFWRQSIAVACSPKPRTNLPFSWPQFNFHNYLTPKFISFISNQQSVSLILSLEPSINLVVPIAFQRYQQINKPWSRRVDFLSSKLQSSAFLPCDSGNRVNFAPNQRVTSQAYSRRHRSCHLANDNRNIVFYCILFFNAIN